ncbi:MAG TPA: hypothetical protein DIT65_06000 [Cryomorphaceae bacterium]|nr:hypothetical protein [Cryomorphaceae bacterium]
MLNSRLCFTFLACSTAVVASAQVQEITAVLSSAPTVSRNIESTDTLMPPFADDFSYPSDKPTSALWHDAKVWVNDEMALFQKSLGVATFDGLNEFGFAYKENALGSDSMADVLTSAYLDLQGLSNVYLSFQLQEGGRGELPSTSDSIVVEYWSPITLDWTKVWGKKGSGTSSAFTSVILPVQGANYLQKGFQFRFAAFGARAGAYDIWNIDYVQLDKDRNAADTIITEPAIARAHPLIIGSGAYTSWPWWVSNASSVANRPSTLEFVYRRNGTVPPGGWSLNLGQFRWEENGSLVQQTTAVPVITNTQHNQDQTFNVNVPASAMTSISGPTTVSTKVWFDGSAAGFRSNDTVRGTLVLNNYLSLDDGSAERAYAIQNVIGGRVAQKFKVGGLGGSDTLKGIYFNFVDAGEAYTSTFRMAVWSPADSGDGPGNILYMSDSLYRPFTGYYRGDMMPYELDSGLSLNAYTEVWIGYICTSPSPMYLGLDQQRSLPSGMPRYYGDGFNWYQSLEPGVAIMRPYFRYSPIDMAVEEFVQDFNVHPNPSYGNLIVEALSAEYVLRTIDGATVAAGRVVGHENLELNHLDAGLYILSLRTAQAVSQVKWIKL